jgi:hypothetical protein
LVPRFFLVLRAPCLRAGGITAYAVLVIGLRPTGLVLGLFIAVTGFWIRVPVLLIPLRRHFECGFGSCADRPA